MKTFFFYDLETSGLSPREDRIMQFAGQRTDLDLNPLGSPVNFYVKLDDDTLPSPEAILTTKITPQKTLEEGITENELCEILVSEIFTPDTISLGYNNVRFDDEFIRHLFWRNFIDPYEWQWKDGRNRWDLLDIVRITRALRGEGISWPVTDEGKPTNRLELLTKMNNLEHESAHDASSDVFATIAVARLIREKQPKLFSYFFTHRDKNTLKPLLDPKNPQNLVYTSGSYGATHNFTTVIRPLAEGKNSSVLVYDLRYSYNELKSLLEKKDDPTASPNPKKIIKSVALNRCPVLAPLSILDAENGWEKLDLNRATVLKNAEDIEAHKSEILSLAKSLELPPFPPAATPESALYDAFLPDSDRRLCEEVRNLDEPALMKKFHPTFADPRLSPLFLHYKAKNFKSTLTDAELAEWESYRATRLNAQSKPFLDSLTRLKSEGKDDFLLEELSLYFSSLAQ